MHILRRTHSSLLPAINYAKNRIHRQSPPKNFYNLETKICAACAETLHDFITSSSDISRIR